MYPCRIILALAISLTLLGRIREQNRHMLALSFAHASLETLDRDPVLSLLLAREAVRRGLEVTLDRLTDECRSAIGLPPWPRVERDA